MSTKRKCDLGDCDRPHAALGLCRTHYQRQRRGKSIEGPIRRLDKDVVGPGYSKNEYVRRWRMAQKGKYQEGRRAASARQVAAMIVAKNHPEEFAAEIDKQRVKRGLEPTEEGS